MDLISVPTIVVCIFIAMSAISLAMSGVWLNNRSEEAAGFWGAGFMAGALSGLIVAIFGATVPNALVATATLFSFGYALVWSGYRAFNGQRPLPLVIFGTPAIVMTAYLIFPNLRLNPNHATALQSAIVVCFALASAATLYLGRGNARRLPMCLPLTVFLLVHAAFHVAHAGFALTQPVVLEGGRMAATWFKVFILEAFLNVIVVSTGCLMLIKERSEERHRIASETDPLTGISNRRAFVRQTDMLLRARQDQAMLAIIDLDHFKQINDQYGHQAGDHVLVEFARIVCSHLPESALFGRIGGEEFAIFVPEGPYEPETMLENLRRRIAEMVVVNNGNRIPLTASIGMASVEKAGANFDQLVAAADCALYIAKDEGRNRVVTFSAAQRLRKIVESDGSKRIGLAEQRISRRAARPVKRVINS